MKKSLLTLATISVMLLGACQNNTSKQNDPSALSAQSIAVHDEIMPQISAFDKHTVLIDSLLGNLKEIKSQNPATDTAEIRDNLQNLKTELESATDKMMTWMKEFEPDSAQTAYQQAQFDSISNLKETFSKAAQNADRLLTPFNK